MAKKIIKTHKDEFGRVMLVRNNDGRYSISTYDYETETLSEGNVFYTTYENALKHFNKMI